PRPRRRWNRSASPPPPRRPTSPRPTRSATRRPSASRRARRTPSGPRSRGVRRRRRRRGSLSRSLVAAGFGVLLLQCFLRGGAGPDLVAEALLEQAVEVLLGALL